MHTRSYSQRGPAQQQSARLMAVKLVLALLGGEGSKPETNDEPYGYRRA